MDTCALCRRLVRVMTKHHLIPKTRHKNKKNKKAFSRQEVKEWVVLLCRPCHRNIHTVCTNKELEREYNTLEALQVHPEIAKFRDWIRTKPDGTAVPSRRRRRR